MPIKKNGLKGTIGKITYDKPDLDKKIVSMKKSMDEVIKVLNGNTKNTKK